MERELEGRDLRQLKSAAHELFQGMERLNPESLADGERELLRQTAARAMTLFREMEGFIDLVVTDLEQTEDKLKKNSSLIFGQVSEQLDKVTESTQIAVEGVLNRVDRICESQNEVFGVLGCLREKLGGLGAAESRELVDCADRIEGLENRIQLEAFEIMNEMQFQDIASQQLQHANHLIEEAKQKLIDFREIVVMLGGGDRRQESGAGGLNVFDPGATMKDREQRQHLADEVAEVFDQHHPPDQA